MSRRKQRWSIQVDEYPAAGHRSYGERTVIASHDGDYVTQVVPNTEVDEIFIGGFIHIEAMSSRDYWMNIAGLDINVHLGRNGRPVQVIYRVEAEDGVEYVDD